MSSFTIQVSQNRGRQCCSPRSTLPTTTHPTYPLPAASTSLTTSHSNSCSDNDILRLLHTHGVPISLLRHPDWKTEMWEVGVDGLIIRDRNCRTLLLAVTTVDGEQVYISRFAEEVSFRRAWPLSTISMPYTNNNGNNGHGLCTITNSHISLTILQQLLTFSSLLTSTSPGFTAT